MKVIKDKYCKKSLEPTFGSKVIFYEILNPQDCEVGDDVNVKEVSLSPLNKTDRKGKPLFLSTVRVNRTVRNERFIEKDKLYVTFQSGSNHYTLPTHIKNFNICIPDFGSFADIKIVAVDNDGNEYNFSYSFIFFKNKKEWHSESAPQTIKNLFVGSKECFAATQRILNDIEEEAKIQNEINNKLLNLVKEGTNPNVPSDLDWYKNSVQIINIQSGDPHNPLHGNEYAVFDCAGFRFYPKIKFIDSDYLEFDEFETNQGLMNKNHSQFEWLNWLMNAPIYDKFYGGIFRFIDISKEYEKIGQVSVSYVGESGSLDTNIHPYNKYQRDGYVFDDAEEKIKQLVSSVEQFKPTTEEFYSKYNLFKVARTTKLKCGYAIYNDFEQGIGAKDNTYWNSSKRVFLAVIEYDYSIEFFEQPTEDLKKIILEQIKILNEKSHLVNGIGFRWE